VAPPPALCSGKQVDAALRGRDLAADRPQEGGHLAGDRSDHDRQLLAGIAQPAIAGAQPDLRFPGDVAHRFGQPFEPGPEGLADPGGITVGPGRLDQQPASRSIAGLGDAAAFDTRADLPRHPDLGELGT
jgi:hypothetical protein